jgi:hypothetical protein
MEIDPRRKGAYRARSLSILLKRGHCAPTIMETILGSREKKMKVW